MTDSTYTVHKGKVKYNCHHCGEQLFSPLSEAGDTFKCPVCQGDIVTPGSEEKERAQRSFQDRVKKSSIQEQAEALSGLNPERPPTISQPKPPSPKPKPKPIPESKVPTYAGLRLAYEIIFVFAFIYYLGAVSFLGGSILMCFNRSRDNLPFDLHMVMVLIVSALVSAGIGCLFHGAASACMALRDIAINSFYAIKYRPTVNN